MRIIRLIPLMGRISEVSNEAKKQAFFETATTTVFASMPFWLLPLLGYFLFTTSPRICRWAPSRRGTNLCFGLVGSVSIVITKRYGRFNVKHGETLTPLSISFPYGGLFLIITALTCCIAGFTFALAKGADLPQTAMDRGGAQALSWMLMGGATIIFFLITSYSNMLEELEENRAETIIQEQPREETDFLKNWLDNKE